jgi:aspartate aminotransferase-like enzyme
MPMLHPVEISPDVDDAGFRARLLAEHGVEIMGAFGTLAGRIWRIGTMGHNARPAAVLRTLAALADTLGRDVPARRAALDAAQAYFEAVPSPASLSTA